MSENSDERRSTRSLPSVLRSKKQLERQGVSFLPTGATAPVDLPISDDGATFNMAQEVTWVDASTFAVGRWDGTLSLFRFNDSPTAGPLVSTAASTPAMEGVQMIVWLGPGVFASSNDDASMILWSSADRTWKDLRPRVVAYDARLGVANSGDVLDVGGARYLIIGHANGFISTWRFIEDQCHIEPQGIVDLRYDKPTNPWGLHNIRGVVAFARGGGGYVVTGSEDGGLCVVDALSGLVKSRTTYNDKAQRGINSLALLGAKLLVANCAVGPDDANLWSFSIDPDTLEVRPCDRARLVANPSAPQVFNFCTIWGKHAAGPAFFASTEEGALWMGTVDPAGKLKPIGYKRTTSPLGAALAYNRRGRLVLVAYDLHEYSTNVDEGVVDGSNPERFDEQL